VQAEPQSFQMIVLTIFTGVNTLALVAIAYRAGTYARQVDVNSARIKALEEHGSPALGRLEAELGAVKDVLGRVESMMLEHLTRQK